MNLSPEKETISREFSRFTILEKGKKKLERGRQKKQRLAVRSFPDNDRNSIKGKEFLNKTGGGEKPKKPLRIANKSFLASGSLSQKKQFRTTFPEGGHVILRNYLSVLFISYGCHQSRAAGYRSGTEIKSEMAGKE